MLSATRFLPASPRYKNLGPKHNHERVLILSSCAQVSCRSCPLFVHRPTGRGGKRGTGFVNLRPWLTAVSCAAAIRRHQHQRLAVACGALAA